MPRITVIALNADCMSFTDDMPIFGENSGESAPIVRIERRLFQMFKFGVEPFHRFLIASTDDPGDHMAGLPVDRFEDPSLAALARQEMPHFIDLNLTDRRVDLRLGQSARSVPDPTVDCRGRNAADFRQPPKGSLAQAVDKNTEGPERMIGVPLSFISFNKIKAA